MLVANECGEDVACYGKKLEDPSWTRAEKAAFAIGFSGDTKQGIPLLLGAMRPVTMMAPDHFPVHQAILFALARLGNKDCVACIEKLDKQIERDETAVRIPGARDLLGETRVTEAIIQNKDPGDVSPAAVAAPAEPVAEAAPAKGKHHKATKAKGAKQGSKKKHHH